MPVEKIFSLSQYSQRFSDMTGYLRKTVIEINSLQSFSNPSGVNNTITQNFVIKDTETKFTMTFCSCFFVTLLLRPFIFDNF